MFASFLPKAIELSSTDGWRCTGGTVVAIIDEDSDEDEVVVVLSLPLTKDGMCLIGSKLVFRNNFRHLCRFCGQSRL